MEVIYKDVTIILKQNLTAAITFHGVLHGFQAGRGMGTATIETKLLQNLTAMREAVLFKVFLDLQKAYDALDWDRCLDILAAYVVGPRALQTLQTYWVRIIMVARDGG